MNLLGWTTGVEPLDDIGTDEISGLLSCSSEAGIHDEDGKLGAYRKGSWCTLVCHRWGLKWQGLGFGANNCYLDELSAADNWADALNSADSLDDGATRLPTIKELVKIFDYSNSTANDPALPAGHDQDENETKGTLFRAWLQLDNTNQTFLTGYLISSTYRNINGGETTPKILGIEIETGKVVAFDQDLKLCGALNTSGECANPTDVNVYAFKVSEL